MLNWELNCTLASGLKREGAPFAAGFPNTEGGVTGDLSALGICARGKNHRNAWSFIQYMLSEEIQLTDRSTLPVLLSAREARIQAELAKNDELDEAYRLTEEERQMLAHTASGCTAARLASPALFSLFETHMGPYFEGKASFSACEENLREALREYLAA